MKHFALCALFLSTLNPVYGVEQIRGKVIKKGTKDNIILCEKTGTFVEKGSGNPLGQVNQRIHKTTPLDRLTIAFNRKFVSPNHVGGQRVPEFEQLGSGNSENIMNQEELKLRMQQNLEFVKKNQDDWMKRNINSMLIQEDNTSPFFDLSEPVLDKRFRRQAFPLFTNTNECFKRKRFNSQENKPRNDN